MRFKSLHSLLETTSKRISFEGLEKDHPMVYSILKNAYIEIEQYEMLSVLESQRAEIEQDLVCFITKENEPIIFERKDNYVKEEYEPLCQKAGIPLAAAEEIIKAVGH